MRLGKEIARLRQRVHKLSIEKAPPTLRMVIVKDDEIHKSYLTKNLAPKDHLNQAIQDLLHSSEISSKNYKY